MGLPAIQHLPSIHLGEDPSSQFFRDKCKAFAFSTLEKITWIAIVAIAASIFVIAYTQAALSDSGSLVTLAAIMSTYPLVCLAAFAKNRSRALTFKAEIEGNTILKIKGISHWSQKEIEQFFDEHGLDKSKMIENPQKLLPIIARFEVLRQKAKSIIESNQKALTSEIENRALRLENRREAASHLEKQGYPLLLNATFLLQTIQDPIAFPYQSPQNPFELSFKNIGTCRPKAPDERFFDQTFDNRDEYFLFYTKSRYSKDPISRAQIEKDPTPKALRLLIFQEESS